MTTTLDKKYGSYDEEKIPVPFTTDELKLLRGLLIKNNIFNQTMIDKINDFVFLENHPEQDVKRKITDEN